MPGVTRGGSAAQPEDVGARETDTPEGWTDWDWHQLEEHIRAPHPTEVPAAAMVAGWLAGAVGGLTTLQVGVAEGHAVGVVAFAVAGVAAGMSEDRGRAARARAGAWAGVCGAFWVGVMMAPATLIPWLQARVLEASADAPLSMESARWVAAREVAMAIGAGTLGSVALFVGLGAVAVGCAVAVGGPRGPRGALVSTGGVGGWPPWAVPWLLCVGVSPAFADLRVTVADGAVGRTWLMQRALEAGATAPVLWFQFGLALLTVSAAGAVWAWRGRWLFAGLVVALGLVVAGMVRFVVGGDVAWVMLVLAWVPVLGMARYVPRPSLIPPPLPPYGIVPAMGHMLAFAAPGALILAPAAAAGLCAAYGIVDARPALFGDPYTPSSLADLVLDPGSSLGLRTVLSPMLGGVVLLPFGWFIHRLRRRLRARAVAERLLPEPRDVDAPGRRRVPVGRRA